METRGIDLGYSLKTDIPFAEKNILRLGHEFHRFTLNDSWPPVAGSTTMSPNTFMNINDGRRDRYSVFAEWESKVSKEVTMTRLGVGTLRSKPSCSKSCAKKRARIKLMSTTMAAMAPTRHVALGIRRSGARHSTNRPKATVLVVADAARAGIGEPVESKKTMTVVPVRYTRKAMARVLEAMASGLANRRMTPSIC